MGGFRMANRNRPFFFRRDNVAVKISGVKKHSPADKCGIKAGDVLVSINRNEIEDVLDFRFYMTEKNLRLLVERKGEKFEVTLKKADEYDETGMEFDSYLMDRQHSCKNKCIFCFIDQMPKGLRPSLYFKDDDSRLSFLFGNYITLTNLTEHEIQRIINMHISPVNISVHTTNPELRCRMMNNRFAGQALEAMYRFAKAGIKLNTQLVLCPGFNDGKELEKTLEDLGSLYPSVQSICAVPVGLTKFRDGLESLVPFNRHTASKVVDTMEKFGREFKKKYGTRLCYPSDEFYLTAQRDIPDSSFYEEFLQIENGVGMWASTRDDFLSALNDAAPDNKKRRFSVATASLAAPLMEFLMKKAQEKFPGLDYKIYTIRNDFFGETITVAGLLTGRDIIVQLKGKDLKGHLLLPASVLRNEADLFLDDTKPDDLERAVGVPVSYVSSDGYELFDSIISL